MGTKSKKWKKIVSIGGLFLGTGLLVSNMVTCSMWLYTGGDQEAFDAAFRNNYQDTQAFRDHMSSYLQELLTAVSGVEIDFSEDYADVMQEHWERWLEERTEANIAVQVAEVYEADGAEEVTEAEEIAEATADSALAEDIAETTADSALVEGMAEEAADSALAEGMAAASADPEIGWVTVTATENDPYGTTDYERSFFQKVGDDKNILYEVYTENESSSLKTRQVLYSNTNGQKLWEGLPEGYNYIMVLKDGKVTIQQDGEMLDVYGDGYYNRNSEWYLPGYENLPQNSYPMGLQIILAVKKEPVQYDRTTSQWTNYSGSTSDFNRCYYIAETMKEARILYVTWFVTTALGLLLLLLRFLFWKEGSEAKQQIGCWLGSLWWSLKILGFGAVFFLAAYLCISIMDGSGRYAWDLVYLDGGKGMLDIWLRLLLMYFLIEVAGAVFYFGCADLQYGHPWKNTLLVNAVRHIRKLWKLREQRLPFAKRMMSRYLKNFLLFCLPYGIGTALVLLIGVVAFLNQDYPLVLIAAAVLPVLFFCWRAQLRYAHGMNDVMSDMQDILEQIRNIRKGDMDSRLEVPEDSELKESFENLNAIQEGMQTALEEQVKSERMKIELIANVSHDIKTPLTSIISYVEILKQEEDLPEDVKDYIHILEAKSLRLKTMVQDVFEVSKAASGELPVNPESLDLAKLLRQTLADMQEQIAESPVTIKEDIPEKIVPILADGQRLYRVFQNLIVNALKYSLEGSRIHITLKEDDGRATVTVKNTSREELPADVDFTERFVRGDASRTDGGSGLGLSIARSFTEACKGTFGIETNADLFTATVSFPLEKEPPAEKEQIAK